MTEARPFASLSSALLARKGHAKPAMRPQSFSLSPVEPQEVHSPELDDLGWNDMGHEEFVPSEPVALNGGPIQAPEAPPPVVAQQEHLAREYHSENLIEQATSPAKPKAAFTLRLDAERHLRLRLLSAVSRRSAQNIVTQALDDYLARQPNTSDIKQGIS
jgi:hypothetical protein